MRRSRNLPLPAGRLDYIIFVSGIKISNGKKKSKKNISCQNAGNFWCFISVLENKRQFCRVLGM